MSILKPPVTWAAPSLIALKEWVWRVVKSVFSLIDFHNSVSTFTLTINTTTTTVTNVMCGDGTMVSWTPTTANAATELATMYISTKANGSFIVTHANNANADRTFDYRILG